jgi:hypothetical protein
MFLLFARVSLFQLLINWLDALPGITNWNKQVLVLLQEQDTEQEDQYDIDRVISDMKTEKGFDRVNRIETFKDISSWWSLIIKFLFEVKKSSLMYKLVFTMDEMKHSKIAGTLSDIFSSFELNESNVSEYIVMVDNASAVNTGINIYYKSDNCELSKVILSVLIDLKVIKVRTKRKSWYRVLACLLNIMYSVLFVLTCFLNLPFLAIYVPFSNVLTFTISIPTSLVTVIVFALYENENPNRRLYVIIFHNICTLIMCGIPSGVLYLYFYLAFNFNRTIYNCMANLIT